MNAASIFTPCGVSTLFVVDSGREFDGV